MKRPPPPPLPYRWDPLGAERVDRPATGDLVAWRHAVWRVTEVNPVPEVDWTQKERDALARLKPEMQSAYTPHRVIIRPVGVTGDDPRARDEDIHLGTNPRAWKPFHVYPNGHYPVCAVCQEPVPCREQMAQRETEKASREMDRYAMPGVCPACGDPITQRQKSITFEENTKIPGGPPVTFHRRNACRYAAEKYEREWVDADPDHRPRVLTITCPGHLDHHTDADECSEGTACPGPNFPHASARWCRPAYPGGACELCGREAEEQRLALRKFAVERFQASRQQQGGAA